MLKLTRFKKSFKALYIGGQAGNTVDARLFHSASLHFIYAQRN